MAHAAADFDWMMQAACKGQTHLYFPPAGERPGARARREAQAIALCVTCPVAAECKGYAESAAEEFGIWGGESREEVKA